LPCAPGEGLPGPPGRCLSCHRAGPLDGYLRHAAPAAYAERGDRGLIAIQLFALTFPVFGYEASQSSSVVAVMLDWRDMALPIGCATLLIVALFSRYMRSSALDTLAQDYIRAARARGLPERLVLMRHLLRNDSLQAEDYPVLLAYTLVAGMATIVGNLVADIALTVTDPRIRLA
jgi:peptide/nickel transport system permease protein